MENPGRDDERQEPAGLRPETPPAPTASSPGTNTVPGPPAGVQLIRLVRPSIAVLCGPAASGKSTFAARRFRPTQIISSDQVRALVCDDERDQRFQAQAFALVDCLVEQRLSINRLCVVDSTALTSQSRGKLQALARRFRVPCVVFLFKVALETCLVRDQARARRGERSVGAAAIERQYRLYEETCAQIRQEGFDQVFELGPEELESIQIEVVFRPITHRVTAEHPGSGDERTPQPRPNRQRQQPGERDVPLL